MTADHPGHYRGGRRFDGPLARQPRRRSLQAIDTVSRLPLKGPFWFGCMADGAFQRTGRIGDRPSRCYLRAMSSMQSVALTFTAQERDYIRRELDMFFSTLPTVAEGFPLKTWRGGPDAGKPKIPPAARGLIDRGLMVLDLQQRMPRVFFTPAGLAELRLMMRDGRLADPKKFAHVRAELGIESA